MNYEVRNGFWIDNYFLIILGFKDTIKGKVGELEMDPKLKEAGWEKYAEFKVRISHYSIYIE